MDKTTAQALYDLQQHGRLSADVDYEVRDTLDLVSDEEKEAHKEQEKQEKESADSNDSGASKATGATKKAS